MKIDLNDNEWFTVHDSLRMRARDARNTASTLEGDSDATAKWTQAALLESAESLEKLADKIEVQS